MGNAEVKRLVGREYPALGRVLSCRKLAHDDVNSQNFLVNTGKGRYVFKEVFQGMDNPARIERMCRILAYCAKRGAKVPEPVRMRGGAYLAGKRSYLSKFYSGKPFQGTLSQIQSVARELAQLHKQIRAYKISYPWRPNAALYAHAKRSPVRFRQFFEWHREAKRQVLRDSNFSQLIHHDFQPGNILFNGNKVSVMLDFDGMRKGSCAYELAFASFRFGMFGEDDPARVRKKIDVFVREYLLRNRLKGISFSLLQFFFVEETLNRVSFLLKTRQRRPKELRKFFRLLNLSQKLS